MLEDIMNKIRGKYRSHDGGEQLFWKVTCIFIPDFCFFLVNGMIYTYDVDLDDPIIHQVHMAHMPGGMSRKNLESFAQSKLTGRFQDWDYDMEFRPTSSNFDEYGQAKPPQINLKKIKNTSVPVALFVGN